MITSAFWYQAPLLIFLGSQITRFFAALFYHGVGYLCIFNHWYSTCLCCAYVDSDLYAKWIISNTNNPFLNFINNLVQSGVNSNSYKNRAEILKNIMEGFKQFNEIYGLIVIDAACTANFLFQNVFKNHPSYSAEKNCHNCSHYIKQNYSTLIS